MSATKKPFFGLFQYLGEVIQEGRYITWPTRKQVVNQFVLVLIVSALLTGLLYGVDIGITETIKFLKSIA